MYPTQMHLDYIPYGPILEHEPNALHYTIYYPIGFFTLKPKKIPYVQWKTLAQCRHYSYQKVYMPGDYVNDFFLDGTYPIWEQELEILLECYDIEGLDLSKQIYILKRENVALKAYMEELYKGKSTNTGTKKYYFKILLNSLYGKFLSRPDGIYISYANGKRTKCDDEDRPTYYLPLGMFIAMMGRVTLIKAMLSIPYDNVLYCDTDSIIYIGDKDPDVNIGPYMGDWSIENENFSAYIVGPKTYQELNPDGKLITKCAGLSQIILPKLPFQDLAIGKEYNVIKSRRDKNTWQINLVKTTFKISDRVGVLRER